MQPMLVSTTFRITELKYTYGCPTLVEACVYYLYFQNQLVTLNLLVSSPKCSVWLLGLLTELLDYSRLMDAPPKILFLTSTYRITKLHYTYGYATFSAAYVGYL